MMSQWDYTDEHLLYLVELFSVYTSADENIYTDIKAAKPLEIYQLMSLHSEISIFPSSDFFESQQFINSCVPVTSEFGKSVNELLLEKAP